MPRIRNISDASIRGLPRRGDILAPGAECFVERFPDRATMVLLEELKSEEVEAIDAGNLRAVLDDERQKRRSVQDQVQHLREALEAAQARASKAEAELRVTYDKLKSADASIMAQVREIDSLRAELAAIKDAAPPWSELGPRAVLAFANRRRQALGEELFGGRGAIEGARAWLDTDPTRHIAAWNEEQGTA